MYSAKQAVDEVLGAVGGINNTALRTRCYRELSALVTRVCKRYDFKELFVRWRGEIPRVDNVDRMTTLELTNVPNDIDRIVEAVAMKRVNNRWDPLPLEILSMTDFDRQYLAHTWEQIPHREPIAIALRRVEAGRQDVTMKYTLDANRLELGPLEGQDGWTIASPAGALANIQNDTPLSNTDRAVKFGTDKGGTVTSYNETFEAKALGDLAGQDSWVALHPDANFKLVVENTTVLDGAQSLWGFVSAMPANVLHDYRRLIGSTTSGDWWIQTMGAVNPASNASADNISYVGTISDTKPGTSLFYAGWTLKINWLLGATQVTTEFVNATGTQFASMTHVIGDLLAHTYRIDYIGGAPSLSIDGVRVASLAPLPFTVSFDRLIVAATAFWGGVAHYVGIVDDLQWGTYSSPGSGQQYVRLLSMAKRYQFSLRARRNEDVATGTDSLTSLMVSQDSTINHNNRATGAVLGIDIAHQSDTAATLSVFHDGVVQASGITLPSTQTQAIGSITDPEQSMEVIVRVDEYRLVTVTVGDVVVYSKTATAVAADRFLMSGSLGVVGKVDWRALAADFTGLSVVSTVLEDTALEASARLYVDPSRRYDRRFPVTGIGTTPVNLLTGTFFGVKSLGKSDVSRGILTFTTNNGMGEIALMGPDDIAAESIVLQIAPFVDQPYPLLLLYKRTPPPIVGPGDTFSFIPECAVRWCIQQLKMWLMADKEDVDWQAQKAIAQGLEVEMAQSMGADQIQRARMEFDEGW